MLMLINLYTKQLDFPEIFQGKWNIGKGVHGYFSHHCSM